MAYATFRFTPLFFVAVIAWIPIARASDLQSIRDKSGFPSLIRPLAIYLAVGALLWLIFGLHVFAIALFPYYLWKWTLRRSPRGSLPPWVCRAALVSLGAMAASIPLSYALFPPTINEPTVRGRVSVTKQLLRSVEERMRAGKAPGWPVALSKDGVDDPFDYRLVRIPLFLPLTQWDLYVVPHSQGPGHLAYVTSGTAALVWSRGPNTRFDLSRRRPPFI